MFFNLFLLGATGGDIVKIFLIMREAPDKKAGALLSVFIDRVVGVLALAAVSAVVILLRWDDLMAHEVTRYGVAMAGVILGGSIGFIAVAWITGRFDLTRKLPHWLPAREKIIEAAGAFLEYARAGKSVGAAFLLSIPAHLLMFSTFWFGAKAFAAGLNLLSIYCVMPIVATVTALPISIGGAGLREGRRQRELGVAPEGKHDQQGEQDGTEEFHDRCFNGGRPRRWCRLPATSPVCPGLGWEGRSR
jgi:uncharacterized membrane protein YbhN (UPF0104 family)